MTAILQLKEGRSKPVRNRHPWIFSGAVAQIDGQPAPGDIVTVQDAKGRFMARAYYNPHSQICARILTWNARTVFDDAFWQQQIERALAARAALPLEPESNAYRLINAEADHLPGLIVDKYGDYLVMQCLTLGVDRRKQMLAGLLAALVPCAGILERSDVDVRAKEGLPPANGMLWGTAPPRSLTICENGHRFQVNLQTGHKTGFYLDQRENRAAVCRREWVAGKEMLNAFAYTGGFAVYAAANGAGPIVNLDSSATALAQAGENMALNGTERPSDEYVSADAFQQLRHYRDNGRQFDVVILDPPKFAHSRRDVPRATRGYKDLNWLSLRLLRPGGWLATFSCSGLISADLFQKVLFGAAIDAARDVQIVRTLTQGPDHPVLLSFPESAYLKGFLCRVW